MPHMPESAVTPPTAASSSWTLIRTLSKHWTLSLDKYRINIQFNMTDDIKLAIDNSTKYAQDLISP